MAEVMPPKGRKPCPILLVEDTSSLRMVYETVLTKGGFPVVSASDAAQGLREFRKVKPGVVMLDLMLPDRDGLALMTDMMAIDPDVKVIVITAYGSIKRAVEAMRAGAFEFLVKPFDEDRLILSVANARHARLSQQAADDTTPIASQASGFHGFVGTSAPMQEVYRKIASISRSMATVFLSGESGTGKEICAQAVHDSSDRASGPFVPLNCAAIPTDLLESEVFGHLKGSFTGALSDKPGAAAQADGGTLFLDEICEMDLGLQSKLLRFLQTSTIQPVGAPRPRNVSVRIICATNRDPLEEVRMGRFREDLYYRLHVVPIHLPPLRERGDDVIQIAQDALSRLSAEEGRRFVALDEEVQDLFRAMPWPGNVRQLLNVLRNVVVLNDAEVVTKTMLPMEFLQVAEAAVDGEELGVAGPSPVPVSVDGLLGMTMADVEKAVIERTIDMFGGSVTKAARVLDLSPSTIYRKREAWEKRR